MFLAVRRGGILLWMWVGGYLLSLLTGGWVVVIWFQSVGV